MGGDPFTPPASFTEEESSLDQDFPHELMKSSFSSGDEEGLNTKLENDSIISGGSGLNLGAFHDVGDRISSILVAKERQRCQIYAKVLRSYEELQHGIQKLEEAKNKVLSYTPGSHVENSGGLSSLDYDVPETTSLLLIGPKGSGKSSLVNKISRLLENDLFGSERAQVSSGEGTYFLHEYKIPRGSGSFCLFDARGLSDDPSENVKMIKVLMTKGVRHGELVTRESDGVELKARLRCKARRSSHACVKPVNFVIFMVNGLSVLESMDSVDETKGHYSQLIATTFNNPLLSFKDDKPVVVVTHGDLLSLSDRVRIRVYLGELLGIPPTRQIYDIPESDDLATTFAILDMLNYSFERSDRNLPQKHLAKVWTFFMCSLLIIVPLIIIAVQTYGSCVRKRRPPSDPVIKVDWHTIRHLWLGPDDK